MSRFQAKLVELGACQEARDWVGDRTYAQAWKECTRLDWLRWLVRTTAYSAFQDAIATANRAYQDATAEANRAYQEARAPAYRAYQDATAEAYRAYQEARATAECATTPDELRQTLKRPKL